jgi:hypothetical protein
LRSLRDPDAARREGTGREAPNAPDVAGGGSLQIQQDLDFQRRWGVFQRAGLVVLLLVFAAAVAGVFGTGPVAHATADGAGGAFSVEYDRFLRTTQSSALQVSPSTQQGGGGDIAIASSYTDAIDVSDVTPQPDSETATSDRIVLSYQDRLPAQVEINVAPQNVGVHRATLWVRGRPVSFRQVVWP